MSNRSRMSVVASTVILVVAAWQARSYYKARFAVDKLEKLPDSPVYFVSARGHDGPYFASTNTALCKVEHSHLQPLIAEAAQLDRSGLIVTMRLDATAVYADGTPIAAADVVATVAAIKEAHTRSGPYKAKYHNVKDLVALNSRELRWTFYEATGRELADACDLWVLPVSYLQRAAVHLTAPWSEQAPGLPPATGVRQPRGAWRVGELELVHNPQAVRQWSLFGLDLKMLGWASAKEKSARLLVWNGKSRFGADVAVRRAISMMLSRASWQLEHDDGLRAAQSLLESHPMNPRDQPGKAQDLLRAEGWQWRDEAHRWVRHDDVLNLRILVSAELAEGAPVAIKALKRDLASFGIGVTTEAIPWIEWSAAFTKTTYDGYVATFNFTGDPAIAIHEFLHTGLGVRSVLIPHSNIDRELTNLLKKVAEGDSRVSNERELATMNESIYQTLELRLQDWAPITVLARNY